MNEYEIMLLLDPDVTDERGDEIIQRIRTSVEGANGTWDGHEPWGRRRLEYEIDHKSEAIYHLLLFTAPPETLAEITRVLKITDGVLRHGAFRRVKGASLKAPAQSPAPAPPVTETAAPPSRSRSRSPSRSRPSPPMTPRRTRSSLGLRPVGEERTWQQTSIVSCSSAT